MALTVCLLGTYERDYDRNRILRDALRSTGVAVLECHENTLTEDPVRAHTLRSRRGLAAFSGRLAAAYVSLVRRYPRIPEHDAVLVGYLGHFDMFVAAPLARLRRKPVVFDAFISLFDTLVRDRGMVSATSPIAAALKAVDRASCALADLVLVDTDAHVDYFVDELGVDRRKLRRVMVGADESFFFPPPTPAPRGDDFVVLHYSKFAALHGVPYMLEAAKMLEREKDVRFVVVGKGQIQREIDEHRARLGLENVTRVEWMQPEELRQSIATAGACLGIFGATDKAARVIPNKVYQCMAVGGAIVTRDSPGARELLVDGEHALLVPPAAPRAIADAILKLRDDEDLRTRLRQNARRLFEERCSSKALGSGLAKELSALVASHDEVPHRGGGRSAL